MITRPNLLNDITLRDALDSQWSLQSTNLSLRLLGNLTSEVVNLRNERLKKFKAAFLARMLNFGRCLYPGLTVYLLLKHRILGSWPADSHETKKSRTYLFIDTDITGISTDTFLHGTLLLYLYAGIQHFVRKSLHIGLSFQVSICRLPDKLLKIS